MRNSVLLLIVLSVCGACKDSEPDVPEGDGPRDDAAIGDDGGDVRDANSDVDSDAATQEQPDSNDAVVIAESDAVDPSTVCEPIFACSEHCSYDTDYVLMTGACTAAIAAASCAQHAAEVRDYEDACFPRCTDASAVFCNAEGTVTACEARTDSIPRWRTYSCRRICDEELGESFVGCDAAQVEGGDPYLACQCEF